MNVPSAARLLLEFIDLPLFKLFETKTLIINPYLNFILLNIIEKETKNLKEQEKDS